MVQITSKASAKCPSDWLVFVFLIKVQMVRTKKKKVRVQVYHKQSLYSIWEKNTAGNWNKGKTPQVELCEVRVLEEFKQFVCSYKSQKEEQSTPSPLIKTIFIEALCPYLKSDL